MIHRKCLQTLRNTFGSINVPKLGLNSINRVLFNISGISNYPKTVSLYKLPTHHFSTKKSISSKTVASKFQKNEEQLPIQTKPQLKQGQETSKTKLINELKTTIEQMSKLDKNKLVTDYRNLGDFIDKNKNFMQIALLRKHLLQLRYSELLRIQLAQFIQLFSIPHKLFLQNIELTKKHRFDLSFSFSNHTCHYVAFLIFSQLFLLAPLLYRLANQSHKREDERIFVDSFQKLYYLFVDGQQNELISISSDQAGLTAIARSIYAIREQVIYQYQTISKEITSTDSKAKLKYQIKPIYVEQAIFIALKNFENYQTTFETKTLQELQKIIQMIEKDIKNIKDKLKPKEMGLELEEIREMKGQKKAVQFLIFLVKNNTFLPSKKRRNQNFKTKLIDKIISSKLKIAISLLLLFLLSAAYANQNYLINYIKANQSSELNPLDNTRRHTPQIDSQKQIKPSSI